MRKITLVAVLASIAACTPAAETDAPAEPAATEAATASILAVDGGPAHGNYRITGSDGKVYIEVVREDGTYTNTDPDGVVTTGTWKLASSNLYCVIADSAGAEEVCHEESMDENGVWTTRDPADGTVSTIERIEV